MEYVCVYLYLCLDICTYICTSICEKENMHKLWWKKLLKSKTRKCKLGRRRLFWEPKTSAYIFLGTGKPIHLELKESSCWRKAVISRRQDKTSSSFSVIQVNKTHCCPASVTFLLCLMSQVQRNPGPHSEVWRSWGWQVSVSWFPKSKTVPLCQLWLYRCAALHRAAVHSPPAAPLSVHSFEFKSCWLHTEMQQQLKGWICLFIWLLNSALGKAECICFWLCIWCS